MNIYVYSMQRYLNTLRTQHSTANRVTNYSTDGGFRVSIKCTVIQYSDIVYWTVNSW